MSNHNSYTHGSQNGHHSHTRSYSREEEMSKELQIKMMKEKLEFLSKQLEEKDKSLDHYKKLVKTLQDVLTEVSAHKPLTHSHSLASVNSSSTSKGVRPPPGFDHKRNSIKGRKVKSLTTFEGQDLVGKDDIEDWKSSLAENKKEQDMNEPWRRPPQNQVTTPEVNDSNKNRNTGLIKSFSHQGTFSNLLHNQEEEEEEENPFLNRNSSSHKLPNGPNGGKTSIRKTVSLEAIHSASEENRLESKFPELDQLIGQIYPISKYQQGCRFLQKKLDEKNPTYTNIILSELFDHLVELLTDPFGNYLFSKLIEQCDGVQRDKIIRKILPDIMTVAIDMYGTQSLQKMMPFLSEDQIDAVVETLKPNAISLIKHNKANYLVQYCLDHLPPKHNQWIYNAVYDNMEEISRDRVGCVIVKKCIDHATQEQKERLVIEITKKMIVLVQDPFGNYVVQHVLDKFPRDPNSIKMVEKLLGNLNELCVQKFSSNVVEKCLHVADPETRTSMLRELADSDILPQLLNDRFANFVIQTALDVASATERQFLVKTIFPHLGRHYSPYTKKLQRKILQMQQELSDSASKSLSESPK